MNSEICKKCPDYRVNQNKKSRQGYNEFCMKKNYYDTLWIAAVDFEVPKNCPFILEHLIGKSE